MDVRQQEPNYLANHDPQDLDLTPYCYKPQLYGLANTLCKRKNLLVLPSSLPLVFVRPMML